MKSKGLLASLVCLLMFSLLIPLNAFAAKDVKQLRLGIPKDEGTLNPYTYQTGFPGLELTNLLYDPLFILDKDNKPIPWLVKEYQVSEDGKQYKMQLHDNIKWQDGKPLTSEDVKFTYEYVVKYKHSRFTKPVTAIKSIETPDAKTIIMNLNQPEPDFFLQPLSDLPILPKHIWETITDPKKSTTSLGSGPFILEEYKQGQFYRLKANPDYFKGKPPIDKLILPIVEDTTATFTALKAGELDAVSRTVSPELAKEFEKNPNLKLQRGPGYATTMLQFNAEKYPLSEKSVRQAISLAIDPQYLVDTVLLGYGTKGSAGFIHPSSPYYNSKVTHQTDVEKAKSILDQAGFKDIDNDGMREAPDGKKIELVTLAASNSPTRIRTAEIINDWLKKIGLNVSVKVLDYNTVVSQVWPDFDVTKGRNYDMAIWGWSSTMQLTPTRLIDLFYSNLEIGNSNIGAFKSKEFDQLADQLRKTIKPEDRQQIINKMQEQVAADYPLVTLYYDEVMNAYNPKVYDGWVFQVGKGIVNKLSFVNNGGAKNQQTDAAKTSDDANKSQSAAGSDTGKGWNALLALGMIVVVIGAGVFWIIKRNKDKNGPTA